eukprot:8660277-Pyramimonas_sp.AAC.1
MAPPALSRPPPRPRYPRARGRRQRRSSRGHPLAQRRARSGWTRPQLLSAGRSADDESLEASSDWSSEPDPPWRSRRATAIGRRAMGKSGK